jgi:hypothetical protein
MNPEFLRLLDDVTGVRRVAADAVVRAARRRRRRRTVGAAVAGLALVAVAAAALWRRGTEVPVADLPVPPAPSMSATEDELLSSFGDRPVALVTWPDGRQQLFAIARRHPGALDRRPQPDR